MRQNIISLQNFQWEITPKSLTAHISSLELCLQLPVEVMTRSCPCGIRVSSGKRPPHSKAPMEPFRVWGHVCIQMPGKTMQG